MTGAKKRAFPLAQVYRLLEPGPVVMVTTARALRAKTPVQVLGNLGRIGILN
jgi:hypothetical protein